MLIKVISGGQTGADQAGLAAAKACGLETGGWAPKGWLTADGEAEELLRSYGLKEHRGGYRSRTWANVKDADATIRLATNFDSPGEKCTLSAVNAYGRLRYDVGLRMPLNPNAVIDW